MAFGRTSRADRPRTLRKDRTGFNPVWVGLLVLIGVVIISYLGFTKNLPFSRGFEFKAVFPSANSIRLNSPVRIAGVERRHGQEDRGPGRHEQRRHHDGDEGRRRSRSTRTRELKIRPRIFLEGNFFVDLEPGTPSAPTISDGDTIPVDQTATPVQFDQLLTSLQQDTRRSLQTTLQEFGTALNAKPTPAEDAVQPPSTQGKTARRGAELGDRLRRPGAARLGDRPDGAAGRGAVATSRASSSGLAGIGRQLAPKERQLGELVENFNTTMAAFASEQAPLRAVGRAARPDGQAGLHRRSARSNEALPSVRAFSLALVPGHRADAADDRRGHAVDRRRRASSSPQEQLGGLLDDLQPATASLAEGHRREHPAAEAGRPAGALLLEPT